MKVSVVCTNYNKSPWISDAIESFLNQKTTFDFEIIIVDDASNDSSIDIIRDYEKRFPDRIRAFFNTKNKGITKTWIDICKEVRGQYIARCDADDYWTDSEKLQKQVDLLDSSPDSKWSNSDFDMIDENGSTIENNIFKNNIIPLILSYEEMLVLKGMTMASTWLVETELMKKVNKVIDPHAVDDTFNIQLELFRRTKISYLPDSTTVYRMTAESDSRTDDFEKLKKRFYSLQETQLEYIDKYSDININKALKTLVKKNTEFEILLSQYSRQFTDDKSIKIYYSTTKNSFTESNTLHFPIKDEDEISFKLDERFNYFRIDFTENPGVFSSISLKRKEDKMELPVIMTNGFRIHDYFLFTSYDPQILYDLTNLNTNELTLSYRREKNLSLQNVSNEKIEKFAEYNFNIDKILTDIVSYKNELEKMNNQYYSVLNSRRWKITTKIINFFRRYK